VITVRGSDGDKTFHIRPTLLAALKRLRLSFQSRTLWADAICIDQDNHIERNLQVAMMSEIYENAQKVCVWLGGESDNSDMALEFIQKRIAPLKEIDKLAKNKDLHEEWKAVTALLTRPWFERRWIVQEIALGKNAELFCGQRSVEWADFAVGVALYERKSPQWEHIFRENATYGYNPNIFGDVKALGATRLVHVISNLFRRSDSGRILERRLTLEQLVSNLGFFMAREPHDIIYAVLALANDTFSKTRAEDGSTETGVSRFNEDTTDISGSSTPRRHEGELEDIYVATESFKILDRQPLIGCSTENSLKRKASDDAGPPLSKKPFTTVLVAEDSAQPSIAAPHREGINILAIDANSFAGHLQSPKGPTHDMFLSERTKSLAVNTLKKLQQAANPVNQSQVYRVDYKQPFFDVCQQFIYHTLVSTRELDILCRPWAPEDQLDHLPSWVPNLAASPYDKQEMPQTQGSGWRMQRKDADPLVEPTGLGPRYYNASKGIQAERDHWRFGIPKSHEAQSLYIDGFVLDTIRTTSYVAQMGVIPRQWFTLAKWERGTDPPEAFWRTVVADRGPNGLNCPEYYPRACRHAREISTRGDGINCTSLIQQNSNEIMAEFLERAHCVIWNRKLIKSKKSESLGLAPEDAREDDCKYSTPVYLGLV
jgi:hypothetical protein